MRQTFLPFALPDTDETEIEEIAEAIRSGWVTTGPKTRQFETAFARAVDASHAIAVNSCTAAMHLALEAAGVQPGDRVLTTPYTFAATAEVIRYFDATPVFVDVEPDTLNIDPEQLAEAAEALAGDRRPSTADRWLPPTCRNGHQSSNANPKPVLSEGSPERSRRVEGSKTCPERSRRAVNPKSKIQNLKSILPVHMAGLPADLDAISEIAARHGLAVIEDAAHAFPAQYKGHTIGQDPISNNSQPTPVLSGAEGSHIPHPTSQISNPKPVLSEVEGSKIPHFTCFSFYATKTITTGEGGMLCTDDEQLAERCRVMALHGISKDAWKRYTAEGSWYYEIVAPGYKYNMTDIAAAMGLAQLRKAERMWQRRRDIACRYNEAFGQMPELHIPADRADCRHAWHLYLLRLNLDRLNLDRNRFIDTLKMRNIGTSVHFIPLHLHPYYRDTYGYAPTDFPVAYREYRRVVSLPIYSKMTEADVEDVIQAVSAVVRAHCTRRVFSVTKLQKTGASK